MIKNDKISIAIVSSIIIASLMSVLLFTTVEPEQETRITWYFFPGECWLIEPEDTRICYHTDECGWGRFAKSIKGQGMVDQSELWKLQKGLVKIDYSRCDENLPKINP